MFLHVELSPDQIVKYPYSRFGRNYAVISKLYSITFSRNGDRYNKFSRCIAQKRLRTTTNSCYIRSFFSFSAAEDRKLFIGGLSWETREPQLKEYFEKFGEVESVNLKMNPMTGKSRCFAFVVFKTAADVVSVHK